MQTGATASAHSLKDSERDEKRTDSLVNGLVAGVVHREPKLILMLILRREEQTMRQIAERFMEMTSGTWASKHPQNILNSALEHTVVPLGFASKYKERCYARYSLGPNGVYGQEVAALALRTESEWGISMSKLFGFSPGASKDGHSSTGPLNRFRILRRLCGGDARIDELGMLINMGAREDVKSHVDDLANLGITEYTCSPVDKSGDELGRVRVRISERGEAAIRPLVVAISQAIIHKESDPNLRILTWSYHNDPAKLRFQATRAMGIYLRECPYIRNSNNGY